MRLKVHGNRMLHLAHSRAEGGGIALAVLPAQLTVRNIDR
jgi:hypothetical protein